MNLAMSTQALEISLNTGGTAAMSDLSGDLAATRAAPSAHFCEHPRNYLHCLHKDAVDVTGADLSNPAEGWAPHDAAERCRATGSEYALVWFDGVSTTTWWKCLDDAFDAFELTSSAPAACLPKCSGQVEH